MQIFQINWLRLIAFLLSIVTLLSINAPRCFAVTVPAAPAIGSAVAGNAQATVTFTPPTNDGGSAITSYTILATTGATTTSKTTSGSPFIYTGLTNGKAYTFKVKAVNAIGSSVASVASNSVTPATVPGAPTIGTASAGNAQATVAFTAPNNGGSVITGYIVTATSNEGSLPSKTATASPFVFTGLSNGTAYSFKVFARNAIGTGPSSAASNSVTPATVPAAPTISTATAGNQRATVSFAAPTDNGGSAITSYTVTAMSPGLANVNKVAAGSPFLFTGLTNGKVYTFTVKATNIKGASVASAASNSVTPHTTVPDAPTIGTPVSGNAQVSVVFSAPANNGGSTITSYTVTATSSDGPSSKVATASPFVFAGLTNGKPYTFHVTATNALGIGAASDESISVIPSTVPAAPTIGTAVAGYQRATVNFMAPTDNGGSPVISYTVTAMSPGLANVNKVATNSPFLFTGLTNGKTYTFKVSASNIKGASVASAVSNSVIPRTTIPDAPTLDTVTPGNTEVLVRFAAPANNGGAAISSYLITASYNGGSLTRTAATAPVAPNAFAFTGLTNGVAYTFNVKATNALGTSLPSAESSSVIPSALPGAPTIGTAYPGDQRATINFTAPTDTGGLPITSYTVTAISDQGKLVRIVSGGPFVFNNLTNGIAYTFNVVATTEKGSGPVSADSNSVTPNAPMAAQTLYFIHTDHLNTPRVLTNSSGVIVWRWDNNDVFGNNVPNGNPAGYGDFVFNLRYPGQYFDQESGLHYNFHRSYDPTLGRYIESDPIGLNGGVNTYGYVLGNPLSWSDRLGLKTSAEWAKLAADLKREKTLCGALREIVNDHSDNPFVNGSLFKPWYLSNEPKIDGGIIRRDPDADKSVFYDTETNQNVDLEYVVTGWSVSRSYSAPVADMFQILWNGVNILALNGDYFQSNNTEPNSAGLALGQKMAGKLFQPLSFAEAVAKQCPSECSSYRK